MFRIQERKRERGRKKTQLQSDSELGPAQAKGMATPACPGMECPSHYLMSVSPGRKLRNQDVKTLPAASERAREEWDVYVASP